MSEQDPTIRQNLLAIKDMIDPILDAETPDVDGCQQYETATIILARYPDNGYVVTIGDVDKDVHDSEDESATESSLMFNGDTLQVTRAEIGVARLQDDEVSGFDAKISKGRLPGFVAHVAMQVTAEL